VNGLLWIIVICATAAPPATAPAAQGQTQTAAQEALQRQLDEIDQRVAKITSLRADFEQQKHTPMLRQPLVSVGNLLVKGDKVRWDTRKPQPSAMQISGGSSGIEGEIKIYYPDATVVEIYKAQGDLRELSGSPLPRIALLRRYFDFSKIDASDMGIKAGDDGRFIALELKPRTDDLKEHITSVRVLMDASVPCIKKLSMLDADGDRTEIEFKNVQINADIDDAALELKVPPGTRVSRPLGGDAGSSASQPASSLPRRESGK